MKLRTQLIIVAAVLIAACGRSAEEAAATAPQPLADAAPAAPAPVMEEAGDADPRVALAAKMPGMAPEDVRPTPVAGIYELTHAGEVTYVSADGRYVFSGDLFQVTSDGDFPNLTEQRRRALRLEALAALPEKDMIIFGPRRAEHTVTVFTDIDCQWCQRLHTQIAGYNELGIRVRYLAFPRTGPDTDSWRKAEAVWCARDRNAAMTRAKQGGTVTSASCATPVARQYELGREFKLSGTPGVVLPSGEVIPGYLPPKDMLEAIAQSAAEALPDSLARR